MSQKTTDINHKKLARVIAVTRRLTIQKREELEPVYQSIGRERHGEVEGPPFAVFHWDTGVQGVEVEAGYPVSGLSRGSGAAVTEFAGGEAFTLIHVGSYHRMRQSYDMLYTQMYARAIPASLISREIYLKRSVEDPRKNMTEIQVLVHDWNERFSKGVERLFGRAAQEHVLCGSELLCSDSTREERTCWVRKAVERLDRFANEEQKCDILSGCAHVFPEERIERLRATFSRTGDLNAVLALMADEPDWYESPRRDGSLILVEKVPCNKEAFEAARTKPEKRNAYCHCPMVRGFFEETPPSFCYCGGGWYKQLWEGILQRPVRVETLKALTKGDDVCEFAIHLPQQVQTEKQTGEEE